METTEKNDDLSFNPVDNSLTDVITQFNITFHDLAKVTIQNGRLTITIGNRTMRVSLPMVIGVEATGLSE